MTRPIPDIIADVAATTGVSTPALLGHRRTKAICRARFLAIAAIKHSRPSITLLELSEWLGKKDHATAYNALLRFRDLYDTCPTFRADATELGLPARI
jgi:chromosomal replication initiation ATPase DnaA